MIEQLPLSGTTQGDAAEPYVQYKIMHWGYPVAWCKDGLPYDLLVDVNGLPLRVQVKSCHKELKNRPSYQFNTRVAGKKTNRKNPYARNEVDVMAYVAMDIPCVLFTHKLPAGPNVHLKGTSFTEEESWESFKKSVEFFIKKR